MLIDFYFIATCLIHCAKATTYLRENVDAELGLTPYVFKEHPGVKSVIMCAAICSRNPNCRTYEFLKDTSTCHLAGNTANCEPLEDSGFSVKFHEVQLEGGETVEGRFHDAKSDWEATASSYQDEDTKPEMAIDGTANFWSSLEGKAPWLRIKMHRQAWVKGVEVDIRPNSPDRVHYTEIRVGNTDVTDSNEDELLCQNQLCYMIQIDDKDKHYSDCVTPLRGQYVTLQHNDLTANRKFDVGEVNVIFYCEAHKIEEQAPCMPVNFDACENRNLIIGKNIQTATTALDKTSWSLNASSNLIEGYFHLSKLVDGEHSGNSPSATIYATYDPNVSPDKYPWIQIDLSVSKIVKAVHMYSRSDSEKGENILYVEVRVGDVNAAEVVELGSRICVNTVCKTTGGGTALDVQKHDCFGGSPIQGRYITMQRYEYKYDNFGRILWGIIAMAEVDVEFYVQN